MFKNKIGKVLLFFIVFAVILYIAKFVGIIQIFIVPTSGSEPTIKTNSFCLGTNLVKPKKYDFVIFEQKNPKYQGGFYCQRLVGIENDKLQIKNGVLYINDVEVDHQFTLSHAYIINDDYYNWLLREKNKNDIFALSDSEYLANLSSEDFNPKFKRERYLAKGIDSVISKTYHNNWNLDNFGPIIIPKNKIFTLGDNRNASLDSRYLGLIDVDNIYGKVIYYSR